VPNSPELGAQQLALVSGQIDEHDAEQRQSHRPLKAEKVDRSSMELFGKQSMSGPRRKCMKYLPDNYLAGKTENHAIDSMDVIVFARNGQ
jgi:hypothetical protein